MDTLFDLTHLGLLSVSGPDAKKFLQGQLTCNLDDISKTQSRLAAHCNPQGRVISFFRLFIFGEDYYLQMPRELIPIAMKALQKYAVFFKVKLNDASDTLMQIGYNGAELPDMPQTIDSQVSTNEKVCIRIKGELARYLWIGHPEALKHFAASPQTNQWKLLNILQGIPAIYPETSEKFLPHDMDLPKLEAISFNKGCYTGQEIIARMHYRGKLKNHLYPARAQSDEPVVRGEDIYFENKSSGSIVDYVEMDYNIYTLLVIAQGTDQLTLKKKYSLEF